MQVVIPCTPYHLVRHRVECRTRCSLGERHSGKGDVCFQHRGVDAPHLVRHGSKGNGAGDVGRAVAVLRTAVYQYQSLGSQRSVRLRCCRIVHNGTMGVVPGNGVETEIYALGGFPTQRLQFVADTYLCLSASLNGRFQPTEELHHRHTVAQHRAAEALYLCRVLPRLHQYDGRRFTNGTLRQAAVGGPFYYII